MREHSKAIAAASRWQAAVDQTVTLLRENEELIQRRGRLYQRRAQLFRELMQAARVFVDEVEAGVNRRE